MFYLQSCDTFGEGGLLGKGSLLGHWRCGGVKEGSRKMMTMMSKMIMMNWMFPSDGKEQKIHTTGNPGWVIFQIYLNLGHLALPSKDSFFDCRVLHHAYIPTFLYRVRSWWTNSWFYMLTIVTWAATNRLIQITFHMLMSIFLLEVPWYYGFNSFLDSFSSFVCFSVFVFWNLIFPIWLPYIPAPCKLTPFNAELSSLPWLLMAAMVSGYLLSSQRITLGSSKQGTGKISVLLNIL